MSLSNYSNIETLFESDATLVQTGELNGERYVLKSYKNLYSDSYRREKIEKENDIINTISNGSAEVVFEKGTPVLITRFSEGYPLSKFMQVWDFELRVFLQIALEIARELSLLHSKKVIHLDVNVNNIIYDTISKKCAIIDYGSAGLLNKKNIYLGNPERIECDLNFISPEQTGRINRRVDYRSDLYALGIVLYYMATGQPPFEGKNPMELVHCHIAKKITPPSTHNTRIPQVVENIILKLTAKNADERYISCDGLIHDIERCLSLIDKDGEIALFKLAEKDISDQFRMSQKLYGREQELGVIKKAFDRACKGQKELVVIEGLAGTGKSNLVAENHRLLIESPSVFIEGKFDQVNRNIPYSAWVQAFNNFIELILTESTERHDAWRDKIKDSLGDNINYLAQIFPNIRWLIKDITQEEMIFTPETQNRFRIAVESFLKVITDNTNLVLFLDDLQWCDLASIELLKFLLDSESVHNVLFIVAYRQNEIDHVHHLKRLYDFLDEKPEFNHQLVRLKRLRPEHTLDLLKDSLHSTDSSLNGLNELIYDRTEGNPMFYVQYLQAIADDGLIHFDATSNSWKWDIELIKRSVFSDDIVSLLLKKFRKFNVEEQSIMEKAACIGNRFEVKFLAEISNLSENHIGEQLRHPLNEGMIVQESTMEFLSQDNSRHSQTYKFTHDRIQQGIYNSMKDSDRTKTHYAIGHQMLHTMDSESLDKNLFTLVNHLMMSKSLINETGERKKVGEMLLKATKKAKILYDLSSALDFANTGLQLVGTQNKKSDYSLRIALLLNRYELGFYLDKDQDIDLEKWEKEIIDEKPNRLDFIRFQNTRLRGYVSKGEFNKAIREGLNILESYGYRIKEKPGKFDIIKSFIKTSRSYNKKKIGDLIHLPVMEDEFLLEISNTFLTINVACYFSNKDLWAVIVSETTRLFINNGLTPSSALTFGSYASILIIGNGDIKSGVAFGRLSLEIPKRLGTTAYLNQTLFIYYALINWWEKPLMEAVHGMNEAMHLSRSVGDLQFLGHCAAIRSSYKFETGLPLSSLMDSIQEADKYARESKEMVDIYLVKVYGSRTLSLLDKNLVKNGFNTKNYDYEKAKQIHLSNNQLDIISSFYLNKGIINFYLRNFTLAYENILQEEETGSQTSFGTYNYFCFRYFKGLIKTEYILEKDPPNRKELIKYIKGLTKEFKKYASHTPVNFESKYLLLKTCMARLKGHVNEAITSCYSAIESSLNHKVLQEEVVGWEIAAHLHKEAGQSDLARYCLQNAYLNYIKWQAWGIVKRMEISDPWLKETYVQESKDISPSHTPSSSLENLDLNTLVKATEAISKEIDKEKLLRQLVLISVENAGAERGYLILNKKDKFVVNAFGNVDHKSELLEDVPVAEFDDINSRVINYVIRTEKPFLVADAYNDPLFIDSSHIRKNKSRSVFCMPIMNKTVLSGMLYLINDLTVNAFSEDRVKLISLLSGQIAISLENAKLVENLEEIVKERTEQIHLEKEKSEDLLLNILPKMTATELKLTGKAEPRYYDSVSVMFIDFKNFSKISHEMDYRHLVKLLDIYFKAFDKIISKYDVEKIKTIGDAYLCVSGLPLERSDHAQELTRAAIEINQLLLTMKKERQTAQKHFFEARIGIHSGPVVAGVVGTRKFAYDIWGDTVNIAARIEAAGQTGKINISQATQHLVNELCDTEYRGKIPVKNMKDQDMYFVLTDENGELQKI